MNAFLLANYFTGKNKNKKGSLKQYLHEKLFLR